MSDQDQGSKLHIDADWKKQARQEKQRLAEEARKAKAAASQAGAAGGAGAAATSAAGGAMGGAAAQAAGAGAGAAGQQGRQRELPPANFQTLVSTMVTQAMFALGMIADPQSGRRQASPDMARHHIDMLGVIEEKTAGNLDDEEAKMLATSLYELRMNYVDLCKQVMRQQTGRDEPAQAGGGGQARSGGAGSPIISG